MLLRLIELFVFLQPPPSVGGGSAPSPAPSAGATSPLGGLESDACALNAGLMLVMFAFIYFAMIRPEKKRREGLDKQIASIQQGTKIRTTGGILGEVVALQDADVVISVSVSDRGEISRGSTGRVRMNVLRANIASVLTDGASKTAAG